MTVEEVNYTYKRILKNTLILAAPIAVVILIFSGDRLAALRGLAFGTLFSLLSLRLLTVTLNRAVQLTPERARLFVASRYFIRYVLTFIILYIAIKVENINMITTIIGLFLTKIVILVSEGVKPKRVLK
jgi:hypothetical protein